MHHHSNSNSSAALAEDLDKIKTKPDFNSSPFNLLAEDLDILARLSQKHKEALGKYDRLKQTILSNEFAKKESNVKIRSSFVGLESKLKKIIVPTSTEFLSKKNIEEYFDYKFSFDNSKDEKKRVDQLRQKDEANQLDAIFGEIHAIKVQASVSPEKKVTQASLNSSYISMVNQLKTTTPVSGQIEMGSGRIKNVIDKLEEAIDTITDELDELAEDPVVKYFIPEKKSPRSLSPKEDMDDIFGKGSLEVSQTSSLSPRC